MSAAIRAVQRTDDSAEAAARVLKMLTLANDAAA